MAVGADGRLWATNGDNIAVCDETAWVEVYGPAGWARMPDDGAMVTTPLEVAPDGSIWLAEGSGFLVIDPTVGK